MRAAAYSGTKNIYKYMLTSAKSLLMHSNVEKIYFLIEDDEFPYDLPKEVECINISNQTWFPSDGPNFKNILSYMVLIRGAYTKLFPDLDRILSIDMDTIVNENISDLWDLDLTDYYLAATKELEVSAREGTYINMGVAMLNLKKMREEHKDDELIYNLNNFWYRWCDQDAINFLFRGHILLLPADYNACWQAGAPMHEKITHFAGIYDLNHFPIFEKYWNIPLDNMPRNLPDNITLDIIIPTYKDKDGLRHTLNSIQYREDINIIVVDDASNLNYADIEEDFPYVNFYYLKENVGPGMARQYGINHSNSTYIMFLDTGDYLEDNSIQIIMQQLNENTYIKLYSFSYIKDETSEVIDAIDNKAIGKIYQRAFMETYNITFCKEGSYANEDYGFNRAYIAILGYYQARKFTSAIKHIDIPIVHENYNPESLTKANNKEYFYTKLAKGLATNTIHALNILEESGMEKWGIANECASIIAREYYIFLCIIYERPELASDTWNIIRYLYFKSYYKYKFFAETYLKQAFQSTYLSKIKKRSINWEQMVPINIIRFIKELETETFIPDRYLIGE